MPLTTLDSSAALVVIDLQKGIVGVPAVPPMSDVVDRAALLARAFRERGLPVVLVNVTGGAPGRTDPRRPRMTPSPGWEELVPELEQSPDDMRVTKRRPGAFLGTNLEEMLRGRGVTQVFLAGVVTSLGVESTARSAYDLGYNVVFVVDAMTDRDTDMHRHCVEKVFPRLGETCLTEEALRLLASESASLPAANPGLQRSEA